MKSTLITGLLALSFSWASIAAPTGSATSTAAVSTARPTTSNSQTTRKALAAASSSTTEAVSSSAITTASTTSVKPSTTASITTAAGPTCAVLGVPRSGINAKAVVNLGSANSPARCRTECGYYSPVAVYALQGTACVCYSQAFGDVVDAKSNGNYVFYDMSCSVSSPASTTMVSTTASTTLVTTLSSAKTTTVTTTTTSSTTPSITTIVSSTTTAGPAPTCNVLGTSNGQDYAHDYSKAYSATTCKAFCQSQGSSLSTYGFGTGAGGASGCFCFTSAFKDTVKPNPAASWTFMDVSCDVGGPATTTATTLKTTTASTTMTSTATPAPTCNVRGIAGAEWVSSTPIPVGSDPASTCRSMCLKQYPDGGSTTINTFGIGDRNDPSICGCFKQKFSEVAIPNPSGPWVFYDMSCVVMGHPLPSGSP